MRSLIVIAGSSCAVLLVVLFAYIKGHRDGATLAELRSANYGLLLYDSFDDHSPTENKEKLGQLIIFHQDWATSGPSSIDAWNYWRNVRVDEVLEGNEKRLEEIGDEIPPPMSIEEAQIEVEKLLSEQGVDPNRSSAPLLKSESSVRGSDD